MPANIALWVIRGAALAWAIYRAQSDRPDTVTGPTYSADPLRNTKNRDLPVPVVYGENLVAGNIIDQKTHLEDEGTEDERVTGVDYAIALSEGPINDVQNISAGGVPLVYVPGATYKAQAKSGLFPVDERIRFRVQESDVGGYISVAVEDNSGPWPELLDPAEEVRNTPFMASEEVLIGEDDVGIWEMWSYYPVFAWQTAHIIKATIHSPTEDPESLSIRLGEEIQHPHPECRASLSYPYLAYVFIKLGTGELALIGMPVITSVVQGRKIWTGGTIEFNNNPAWCLLDLLTNERYGLGMPIGLIDTDSFAEAADYCDELIDVGGPESQAQEKRFELDIVLDNQGTPKERLQSILSTCRGSLVPRGDKQALVIDKVLDEPVAQVFDLDNIVEGSFGYSKLGQREKPNKIIVEYTEPDKDWEIDTVEVRWEADIKAAAEVREQTYSLMGINRRSQAKRMAWFLLYQVWITDTFATWEAGIDSVHCEIGDIVSVTHDLPAWSGKLFRILEIEETQQDTARITAQEYNAMIYTDEDVEYDYPTPPDLPNPNEPPASVSNLTLVEQSKELKDGTWIPQIKATWEQPDEIFWAAGNVYISTGVGAPWQFVIRVEGESTTIDVGGTGEYRIKVVSENRKGIKEDFDLAPHGVITIKSKEENPEVVVLTEANWTKDGIEIKWSTAENPDFERYEVYIEEEG